MLPIAVSFISIALVLYTIAILRERKIKKLKGWIICVFCTAFLCDLSGTLMMFKISTAKFSFCLHTICGYSALVIMAVHLFLAILVAIIKSEKYENIFTKRSIIAWVVWLVAFFSGIPKMQDLIVNLFT